MSHGLARLMRDTVEVLEALNLALDGDEPSEERENQLQAKTAELLTKFQNFPEAYKPAPVPASEQSLKRLGQLKKDVEKKNLALEKLRMGLKAFELEMSLRSGLARKEDIQNLADVAHTDLPGKRFQLDEPA
ncbi:hypothetical protein BASA81_002193 [Batrachochytrium salamandrivorans]|nr:hypothetical protein BASA81_002193 [Batrachochytrium salamandrivorans]